MAHATEVDVHAFPAGERHPRILAMFDALPEGEALVLKTDHYPKPLLYVFQSERPGAFEWNVLEAGRDRFRVEVVRRKTTGHREVTELLMTDHARLDAILAESVRLAGAAQFEEARRSFSEFTCGLTRHIAMEETILFPVFEGET